MDRLLIEKNSSVLDGVTDIMTALLSRDGVEAAVLSTEDGLSVQRLSLQGSRLAAVSGFMQTAAQQAFLMMNLDTADEIVIRGDKTYVLISRAFYVSRFRLILTMIVDETMPYTDMVAESVTAIQQVMER